MGERLLRWFIFSVIIALLPIIFNGLSSITRTTSMSLESLIKHGELLLITAALCAAAIGQLFGSGEESRKLKILAGGSATIILALASLYFADISAAYLSGESVRVDIIFATSIWLFIFAIVSSGGCIALAED